MRPNYRSRLVTKEFNKDSGKDMMAEHFAATPPLEALKILISLAAQDRKKVIIIADVSRAFFEAEAEREVCVELPLEHWANDIEDEEKVGKLRKSLYGTRDAAKNWQTHVTGVMEHIGFRSTGYNKCLFEHESGVAVLVHGDDFVACGRRMMIRDLWKQLNERFQLKTTILGDGEKEVRQARVLNRLLKLTADGWEYEADQRHKEILLKNMSMEQCRVCATPGVATSAREPEEPRYKSDAV